MSERKIDHNKCSGCGKCVTDCINNYLVLKEDENGNRIASFKERGRCLECGHCNAICPNEAISGGRMLTVTTECDELLFLMANKRTCRQFIKGSSIQQDILDRILLAGQTAPTDRNRKSARIVLIKDILPKIYNAALDFLVDEVKKTGSINPLYASTLLLNEKREEILWNAEYLVVMVGIRANIIDAAISAERMQLEATALGIGTAYRGDMTKAINNVYELRELLGIRENEDVLVAFAMGNTKLRYLRSAVKNNRKVEFK